MPYQTIPGTKTKYRPLEEALADPSMEFVTTPDGTILARKKPNAFTKALPWIVMGTMGAGALMAALPAAGAAAGAASGAGAAGSAGAAGAGAAGAAGAAAGASAGAGTVATAGLASTALKYGLQYGIPIAGSLIGSKIQSNAIRDASAIEQRYMDKALAVAEEERDYSRAWNEEDRGHRRAQYADFNAALEPYRKAGVSANERLSGLMNGSVQVPRTPAAGYLPAGNTVRLRAPTGEERDVPMAQAQMHIQRGAVRV